VTDVIVTEAGTKVLRMVELCARTDAAEARNAKLDFVLVNIFANANSIRSCDKNKA
jgi:hypothetical protein